MTAQRSLVVVSGLSGAGKSTVLRALEDLGYFCVDNLPTTLVAATLEACEAGGITRVALGIDVRVRSFLGDATSRIESLAPSHDLAIVFLDASDEALLRRFNETRRPHPMSRTTQRGEQRALDVLGGVHLERERLTSLRDRATHLIDTTALSVHDLRRRILASFGPGSGESAQLMARFVSFGFKYGAPVDADIVFDVRFLENPYFVPELKHMAGTEREIIDFVLRQDDAHEFLRLARELLAFTIPRYEKEGKAYLTVAIGCTGGQHRSVVVADRLARQVADAARVPIAVVHRDLTRPRDARPSDAPPISYFPEPTKSAT